jgi:iron complex transport system permease protein
MTSTYGGWPWLSTLVLSLFLLGVCLASLLLGIENISIRDFFTWLRASPNDFSSENYSGLILEMRTSRVVVAVLVGASLAISGQVLQKLLQNPLADPYVMGISTGGSVFVVGGLVFGGASGSFLGFPMVSFLALLGCLMALILLLLAQNFLQKEGVGSLALIGLVLNAFFAAALMILIAMAKPSELAQAQNWLAGSLAPLALPRLILPTVLVLILTAVVLRLKKPLESLAFGWEFAQTIGISALGLQSRAFLCVSVLVALSVSLAGGVGFVGLLVPHVIRRMPFFNGKNAWIHTMLLGAALVAGADILARVAAKPAELPVGIFLACVGAPVLAWVLFSQKSQE